MKKKEERINHMNKTGKDEQSWKGSIRNRTGKDQSGNKKMNTSFRKQKLNKSLIKQKWKRSVTNRT